MLSEVCVEPTRASFVLQGSSPALANALRRTMIADVPVVAVDALTIHTNTSSVPDELIGHRMGLMPVREGCTELFLRATGPATVYSDALVDKFGAPACVEEEIVVVKLLEGQAVELSARCRISTGRDHAKWSPVVAARYQQFTRGVTYDECFCEDTDWSTRCGGCGRRKRPASKKHAPRCHRFTFSTLGSLSAAQVLWQAVQVLLVTLARVEGEAERAAARPATGG